MRDALALATLVFSTSLAWSRDPRIPSQPCHVIPFEFSENTVWLNVTVNGKGPLTFMLDTAAANFAVDWGEAERLGLNVLEVLQSGPVGSGDGTARVGIVRDATVGIGPVEFRLPHIGAVSFEHPRKSWSRKFDGVVGTPFFEKYVVAVDYAAREMRLYDPESYEYAGAGYVWPVRLTAKAPYVKASFAFPGRSPATADFLLDSGMRGMALFSSPYAVEHRLEQAARSAGRRLVSQPTFGAQGESGRWVTRIESISVGPFTIKQPVAGISTAKGGFFAQRGPAGALGTEMLRRFTVIFDYDRGRLILEPNSASNDFESFDASGLLLLNEGGAVVRLVAPDSPASEAGIKPGDRVIQVDSVPGTDLWPVRQALLAEGETVNLAVDRAGKRLDFALKLRKLL